MSILKIKRFFRNMQDTLCIHTLRSHDGTWSEQPVHAQVYTCPSQSAGMYRSFHPNESSPVPFRVETMDLHLGSEDRTISCYSVRMHLCSSYLNYNYITCFYLGCTSADCFILSKVLRSLLFLLFFGYLLFFSIRYPVKPIKFVSPTTCLWFLTFIHAFIQSSHIE